MVYQQQPSVQHIERECTELRKCLVYLSRKHKKKGWRRECKERSSEQEGRWGEELRG
jgi:hypothetical protein